MILAFETAVQAGASVALVGEKGEAVQRVLGSGGSVAAQLVRETLVLLAEAGVKGNEVEGIAVDCGPGSFTGIRIGIATARGLGDGWGVAVWGVSQFDAFPRVRADETRLLLLDAGYGGGVYYQLERGGEVVVRGFSRAEGLGYVKEIAEGRGVVLGWRDGIGLDETRWERVGGEVMTDAVAVGRAALRLREAGRELLVEPLYLHTEAYRKSVSA